MKKVMIKIKYWIYIVLLSIKWIFKINLSDRIWYCGKQYVVSNGVMENGWRLLGLKNDAGGWVKRSECQKVKSISNYLGSFKMGYSFYMSSWYSIWCNEGIKPWMRNLNIWGSRK